MNIPTIYHHFLCYRKSALINVWSPCETCHWEIRVCTPVKPVQKLLSSKLPLGQAKWRFVSKKNCSA